MDGTQQAGRKRLGPLERGYCGVQPYFCSCLKRWPLVVRLAASGHLAIACSNLSLLGQLGKFWNGPYILMRRRCCNPSQALRRGHHLVDPLGHAFSRPTDVDVSSTSWVTGSTPRLPFSHVVFRLRTSSLLPQPPLGWVSLRKYPL